jgi:hypothetical protein
VAFSEEDARKVEEKWEQWNPDVRLIVFVSRYREILQPLVEFINRAEKRLGENETITVLLPQFITHKWWQRWLHNQSADRIRSLLLARKDVMVSTVPYHLKD